MSNRVLEGPCGLPPKANLDLNFFYDISYCITLSICLHQLRPPNLAEKLTSIGWFQGVAGSTDPPGCTGHQYFIGSIGNLLCIFRVANFTRLVPNGNVINGIGMLVGFMCN